MAGKHNSHARTSPPAGNVYDKYGTKNPIERILVGNFINNIMRTVKDISPATVLDAGCGEGHITGKLSSLPGVSRLYAFDLDGSVVKEAKERFPGAVYFRSSVYEIPFNDESVDIIVACEVLEHLHEPERALEEMERVTRDYLLISVPMEPLWRLMNVLRLKYLSGLGNTPGHVQHWSRRGIAGVLGKRFDVVSVSSPLPWTVCLCRKRR